MSSKCKFVRRTCGSVRSSLSASAWLATARSKAAETTYFRLTTRKCPRGSASWSGNRVIAEQCGQVWLNTANEIAKYFGGTNPQLPYVQIATWNDYEEGTEVESGIDNCYAVNASISGAQLSWSLATSDLHATPATVHHFNIYYADAGGYLYTAASNLSVTTNSLNLSSMVPPGSWTVYVEMVGQPLIINRMSSGLAFQNGASVGQLSTAAFDFGNQTVGTSSSGQKITLKNSGPASMRIYSINVTGDFAQINNCPGLLTSGTSCTVTVTFSPSVNGNRTGSLQVSDSAGSAPQVTSLNGTGIVPVVSFSPASISFAAQPLTSTSTAQVATLSNAGPGVLIINSVAASGDFSLSNNWCDCGWRIVQLQRPVRSVVNGGANRFRCAEFQCPGNQRIECRRNGCGLCA